jgi:hypothetical protein
MKRNYLKIKQNKESLKDSDGFVRSSTLMWIHEIELLLQKCEIIKFLFEDIVAISGSEQ